ncbi:MAG TPA: cytochrome c oxidase subunit 4 [Actinomycetes bacterium]
MKVEGRIFAGIAVFFAIVAAVYGVLSREVIGTTALILSAGLSTIIAVYLLFTSTRIDPRPEDNELAEIADGAGEYGFYSPHSWWPIIVAGSAALTMLGFAFGWWLIVLGAIFLIGSAIGFVFEYYHGHHVAG